MKNKETIFNLTVQDLEKASRAVSRLAHGLAPSEEAGRVTDWRSGAGGRRRSWRVVRDGDRGVQSSRLRG